MGENGVPPPTSYGFTLNRALAFGCLKSEEVITPVPDWRRLQD